MALAEQEQGGLTNLSALRSQVEGLTYNLLHVDGPGSTLATRDFGHLAHNLGYLNAPEIALHSGPNAGRSYYHYVGREARDTVRGLTSLVARSALGIEGQTELLGAVHLVATEGIFDEEMGSIWLAEPAALSVGASQRAILGELAGIEGAYDARGKLGPADSVHAVRHNLSQEWHMGAKRAAKVGLVAGAVVLARRMASH